MKPDVAFYEAIVQIIPVLLVAETIRASLLIRDFKSEELQRSASGFQKWMLYSMYIGFITLTFAEFIGLTVLAFPSLNSTSFFVVFVIALAYGWTGFITALFLPFGSRPNHVGRAARAGFLAAHLAVVLLVIGIIVWATLST